METISNKTMKEEKANKKIEEFLTFTLGEEKYAVQLMHILEIKGLDAVSISSLSNAPSYLKGIIELHEKIVPIVDLKTIFNIQGAESSKVAVVIILEAKTNCFGVIVDSVADIISLDSEQIKDPPEYYAKQFIKAIGALENDLFLILDVEGLVQSDNLEIMQHARERK